MVLGEWQRLLNRENQTLSPALPVLFHVNGEHSLEPDDYADGLSVRVGRYWDSRCGWQPCVMVELGDPF